MQTIQRLKTSDKVREAIKLGFKKKSLSENLGISRPTFDARLKDNCWQLREIQALNKLGII